MKQALDALEENHKWHVEYDDLSGYQESEIHTKNLSAIEALRAAIEQPDVDLMAGWIRAADDEMICTHLGVANLSDSHESAKEKLKSLIDWHVAVATDPAVNGGYQLVPIEPTEAMLKAGHDCPVSDDGTEDCPEDYRNVYKAMLEAAKKETK